MKAARAVDLDESRVEPWGLAGDRRWLLVDEDGRFISQREEPSLARVVVTYGPGGIYVSADGRTALAIAEPQAGAALAKVTVWSSTLLAAEAGPAADAWFSAYLGGPVRLVYLDDPTRRPVDPQYRRRLAPHPHRRGTVPRGQAVRAVCRHHHRPDHRRPRQAAAHDARPASAFQPQLPAATGLRTHRRRALNQAP